MKYHNARKLIESAIDEAKIGNQDAGKLFGSKGKYAPSKGRREPSYAERMSASGAIRAGSDTKKEILRSFTHGRSQVHEPTAFERLGLRKKNTSGSPQDLARRIAKIHGQISRLKEGADRRTAEMNEAILKGASARRSILLRKDKEGKKQEARFKTQVRITGSPQTAAFYAKPPEANPMARLRTRKTEKHGMEIGGKKDFSAASKAAERSKKNAREIVDIIHAKPEGTRIKVYGTGPRGKEKTISIHRKSELGKHRYYHSTSGREVELWPSGVGLKVMDKSTKKVMLDKGNDALWESIAISEARKGKRKFRFSHEMDPMEFRSKFGRPKPIHHE